MNVTPIPESCHIIVSGEPHMPLAEALRRLGIHRRTAYRWFEMGKLGSCKHMGRIYCPTSQVVRIQVEQEARRHFDAGNPRPSAPSGPTPPPRPTNPPDGPPKDGAS